MGSADARARVLIGRIVWVCASVMLSLTRYLVTFSNWNPLQIISDLPSRLHKPSIRNHACYQARRKCGLRRYSNNHERHRGNATAVTDNVVEFAFVVTRSRRHVLLQHLHRQYFDSNIDLVTNIKRQVLYK